MITTSVCRFLRPFYCPYLSQSWDSNSYILLYRYFEPSWTLILHDFLMFSILWLFYRYHLTSTPWPIVDMQYFAIAFCQCIHEPTVYICFWHMFFDQKKNEKAHHRSKSLTLCVENPSSIGGFLLQRDSIAQIVPIEWRYHVMTFDNLSIVPI